MREQEQRRWAKTFIDPIRIAVYTKCYLFHRELAQSSRKFTPGTSVFDFGMDGANATLQADRR